MCALRAHKCGRTDRRGPLTDEDTSERACAPARPLLHRHHASPSPTPFPTSSPTCRASDSSPCASRRAATRRTKREDSSLRSVRRSRSSTSSPRRCRPWARTVKPLPCDSTRWPSPLGTSHGSWRACSRAPQPTSSRSSSSYLRADGTRIEYPTVEFGKRDPSWSETDFPPLLAPSTSGRSSCKACKAKIDAGDLRLSVPTSTLKRDDKYLHATCATSGRYVEPLRQALERDRRRYPELETALAAPKAKKSRK